MKQTYIKYEDLNHSEKMILSLHTRFQQVQQELQQQYFSQRTDMVTQFALAGMPVDEKLLNTCRFLSDKVILE